MYTRLSPQTVDHASCMCGAIEEAISCIEGAIRCLKESEDGSLLGYAEGLGDYIFDLKQENEPYEAILQQDYEEEQEALLRQYWRDVI